MTSSSPYATIGGHRNWGRFTYPRIAQFAQEDTDEKLRQVSLLAWVWKTFFAGTETPTQPRLQRPKVVPRRRHSNR